MRFVVGQDRNQNTLFPALLDDYIGDDNPVRAIDVFVDELRLGDLGFDGVQPSDRPAGLPSRDTIEALCLRLSQSRSIEPPP